MFFPMNSAIDTLISRGLLFQLLPQLYSYTHTCSYEMQLVLNSQVNRSFLLCVMPLLLRFGTRAEYICLLAAQLRKVCYKWLNIKQVSQKIIKPSTRKLFIT